MGKKLCMIVGKETALVARLFIMHLVHVRHKSLGPGGLVVAQHADIWLGMGVQMSFKSPIVRSGPGTVAAHESFVALLLG